MYYAIVFFCLYIYILISSSPATLIAPPKGRQSHVPSIRRQGIFPEIRPTILWWSPPQSHLMQGGVTHISNLNSRMAWTNKT